MEYLPEPCGLDIRSFSGWLKYLYLRKKLNITILSKGEEISWRQFYTLDK